MTMIVLSHPSYFCPRFRVFGVYLGPKQRIAFDLHEFDDQDRAERMARRLMEVHVADHFRRVVHANQHIG
jgi:hypothetical protein